MSYRCVKELPIETTTIPVGTVIERVGHDSIQGRAFVTFLDKEQSSRMGVMRRKRESAARLERKL